MENRRLQLMVEVALSAVIAYLLSFVPLKIGSSYSINLSLLALWLLALRRGWKGGVAGGALLGLLQLVTGQASILTIFQAIIEYPFAFTLAGLAGLWYVPVHQQLKNSDNKGVLTTTALATFVACFTEYIIHFFAGWVFWAAYAPEGMSPALFSLIANGVSCIATWFVCWLVLYFLIKTSPRLVLAK
ncbi:MAG: energy-coupled thiamine transporter ThiT [Aerococcus sp.]|nr:energy-coupled thiamine transporter ThiT [Aerococcus sp.]